MKKGFTLIELLAVIVVLAIIALIAVPIILNVIETAKKGALEDSAYGLLDAANIYYAKNIEKINDDITFLCNEDGCSSQDNLSLAYKGKVDATGILLLYSNGKTTLCINSGTYALLKLASDSKIAIKEGTCTLQDDVYVIEEKVSKSVVDALKIQIADLTDQVNSLSNINANTQTEINSAKNSLAVAITNKGIPTTSADTFSTMITNINNIKASSTITKLTGNGYFYPTINNTSASSSNSYTSTIEGKLMINISINSACLTAYGVDVKKNNVSLSGTATNVINNSVVRGYNVQYITDVIFGDVITIAMSSNSNATDGCAWKSHQYSIYGIY